MDIEILNYALTLEYLEDNFYSGALAKFDAAEIEAAGFPSWVRARFEQITAHEAAHVAFHAGALGSSATAVSHTLTLSPSPPSPWSLRAWVSQLTPALPRPSPTRAASPLLGQSSPPRRGTPLGCPSTNPALPVKAFPALTFSPATTIPGDEITVDYKGATDDVFMIFYNGLSHMSAPISNGKVNVPKGLEGTVYTVVSTNTTTVTDDTIPGGPTVSVFPDTV
ncbi:hypothetical protein FRB93_013179 [Tulasnella sp. JGI-2019a]|nr:hypothetical protein FRB93_013179 [Tulasnella sp. JGI-2019a]